MILHLNHTILNTELTTTLNNSQQLSTKTLFTESCKVNCDKMPTPISQKEHFRQMEIPETWNNIYLPLLIEELLKEEKRMNGDVKECLKDKGREKKK